MRGPVVPARPHARGPLAPVVLALVVLALAPALAGCLSDGLDRPGGDGVGGDGTAQGAGSTTTVLYMTGDHQLRTGSAPAGEPSRLPVVSYWETWALEEPLTAWTSPALERDLLVDAARVALHFTAETAATSTGPQGQGFPQFGVWLGTDHAVQAVASTGGPDALAPGEVANFTLEIGLPTGGLVVPAGERLTVFVGAGYAQGDPGQPGSSITALVDGEAAPSRVELDATIIELADDVPERPALDETSMLVGPATALGDQPGLTTRTFELDVGPGAEGLRVLLERTGGVGPQDLDLEVFGPDGELAAGGLTPKATEGVDLHRPNLEQAGAGTYTIKVTNFGHVQVDFTVRAWISEPVGVA